MSTTPRALRGERGFMLIEVLVSAVILVTASLAIFASLSTADSGAGQQQIRTEAANFAQSELERIRSLPIEDIQAFAAAGTQTVVRNGIKFNETMTAQWVSDSGSDLDCTGQDGGLDYMQTNVTISWPGMGQIRPVSLTSLVTPNAGAGGTTGSLSVHVIGASGQPTQGVLVNIKGQGPGGSYSGTTNVNGCVIFAFIPQDTYNLTGTEGGYVDQDSNTSITDTPQVTAAQTTKVEYSFDKGGTTKAAFQTTFSNISLLTLPGLASGNTVPDYPQWIQFWHPQQTYPGGFDVDLTGTNKLSSAKPYVTLKNATAANNAVSSWDGSASNTLLYPFTSPYTVYSGTCPANATQGSAAQSVNITAGQFQNAGTVNVPALQVKVWSGSIASAGSAVGGARVMFFTGCDTWTRYTATNAPTLLDAANNSNVIPIQTIVSGSAGQESNWGVGTLGDPGFPYTTSGKVCAAAQISGVWRYSTVQTVTNTNTTTGTLVNIYLGSGTTTAPTTTIGNCQ